jgi:hypothetical protein
MIPFIGVLFDGFAYGMLLFLLSVGLSVTLGMMNFVNLAHCSFAMVGAYVTITLTQQFGWPFLATLPMAFLAAAFVSILLDDLQVDRPGTDHLADAFDLGQHRGDEGLAAEARVHRHHQDQVEAVEHVLDRAFRRRGRQRHARLLAE